ncbi:MAG: lactate utilization protein [Oscillospiraceae bacterium]|jgi:L-lactate utilization protein LutB|nr:lactate utilization protein [Oscillospiraceae bacterium]
MANVQKLKENLERNGFVVSYYETAAEAKDALVAAINGKTVGFGGSCTLRDMGLFEALSENNQVFWHWKQQPINEARAKANAADVYLTSLNGVAETGELINIDGDGNRLAATTFGDKKVYFVIGVNKIAPDFHSALDRARNIAAPLNARRLNKETPCAMGKEVKCYNCQSPNRICKGITILERKLGGVSEMEVMIINEELGY